ncbi:unnamed protein product, partial [Hapterophycus canaliculatus]
MLVAAHERKLAWELSCGGMSSLACLREHVRPALDTPGGDGNGVHGRAGGGGGCFNSDEQVLSALRYSGYDSLELEDVAVLRSGLGSSADGRVDLKEFMGMCEDIASSHEWYVPPSMAASAPAVAGERVTRMPPEEPRKSYSTTAADIVSRGPSSLPASLFLEEAGREWQGGDTGVVNGGGRGESNWGIAGFSALDDGVRPSRVSHSVPHDSLFMGGTFFGERIFLESSAATAESVLAELKEQLSLLDLDHLIPPDAPDRGATRRGGDGAGRTLGQAIGDTFSRRDPAQTGLLSAREVGLALEDIGVSLKADEVIALVGKFEPPGVSRSQRPRGDGSSTMRNRVCGDDAVDPSLQPQQKRGARGGGGEGLDGAVAEYAPLVRMVVDHLAEAAGIDPTVGGRARLTRAAVKWNDRMPAPAKRLRAVLAAGEGGGGLKRLRQRFKDFDIDGDGCLGRREFMRALNLALACET